VALVLAAALALAWWGSVLRRAYVAPAEETGKLPLFLLGFAALQLVALLLAARQIGRARRAAHGFHAWLALGVALVLLCANAITYFTPALGAPVLALAGFASFGGRSRSERRSPP
jgi:hypothetical protein